MFTYGSNILKKILSHHLTDLQEINRQRKYWLVLSAFVVAVVSYIIFDWNRLLNKDYLYLWTLVTFGLTICIVWWYWTMSIVRVFLRHRKEETEILYDLVVDIKDIKENIKEFLTPDK